MKLVSALPSGWMVRRLKYLLEEPLKYGANEAALSDEPNDPRFVRITDIADDGTLKPDTFRSLPPEVAQPYLLKDGDLLLARSGATVGKSVMYSETWGPCCFAGYLIRARPDSGKALPEYLRYFTESRLYWQHITSEQIQATIQNVSAERYGNLPVVMPDVDGQREIVAFLDCETAKTDALIAKQEQLIATLREDRSATITHAVTKGLNPGVDFKESSIEWAGEIPAGWPVTKIKRLFTVTLGKMLQSEPRSDADLLQPYLRAAHIPPTGFTTEGVTKMWFSPEEARELDLRGGDVVVVEGGMGGYGRCDLVPHDLVGWGFQNSINRLRPRNGAIGEYVMYALQMAREHGFIEALCSVSTMPHLTAEKLGEMRIPGPTAEQQREIVEFLNDACSKIDRLIAKANEVVGRLREYRSALITDAVTGKIDVRGLA